jgi:hypothetical protein
MLTSAALSPQKKSNQEVSMVSSAYEKARIDEESRDRTGQLSGPFHHYTDKVPERKRLEHLG